MSPALRHWYGFGLSLITALMWGMLPVFLKICLQATDAITITWYRFTFAAIFVFFILAKKRALPAFRQLSGRTWLFLLLATLGLVGNYVGYVEGLHYLTPEAAQVLIQLAPFLLMLGGIVFYKERFTRMEMLGALVLLVGMLTFFNHKLLTLVSAFSEFGWGVFLVSMAAVVWAGYALLQKVLMRSLTAKQLTFMLYLMGALLLAPLAHTLDAGSMTLWQGLALLFCCFNTVIGYGCFTEAMQVWQAAKVSAVIALAPVFTIITMEISMWIAPEYFPSSDLNALAYTGALIVVIGSIMAALGKPHQE